MGTILLYLILGFTFISTILQPFIGVCAYYLLAILGPQYIWWWVFGTLRVSFFVGAITIVSILFRLITNKLNIRFLFTKINFFVFLLWISLAISYFFGPYVNIQDFKKVSSDKLFIDSIKIFFFYLFATLAVDNLKKIRLFYLVIVLSVLYLTYWANLQYFDHNWTRFNMGRLQGPVSIWGGSIYKDENVFAMLFVTGIPFLGVIPLVWKEFFKKSILKLTFWSSIIFAIHAIFLTGSRGGLLGLAVITLTSLLFTKRKFLFLVLIIPSLIGFYYWQAGDTMKKRSETIGQYEQESSAQQRIKAWKGGLRMIEKYPLTGVGIGSFISALPDFYPTSPRVAHNTFIQFTAESGLLAGFSYLMIIFFFYRNAFWIHKKIEPNSDDLYCAKMLNIANTVAFTGLTICALFLTLNFYEVFFYLLLINNNLFVILQN